MRKSGPTTYSYSHGPEQAESSKDCGLTPLRMGANTNIFSLEDNPLGHFVRAEENLTNKMCVVYGGQSGVILCMRLWCTDMSPQPANFSSWAWLSEEVLDSARSENGQLSWETLSLALQSQKRSFLQDFECFLLFISVETWLFFPLLHKPNKEIEEHRVTKIDNVLYYSSVIQISLSSLKRVLRDNWLRRRLACCQWMVLGSQASCPFAWCGPVLFFSEGK